MSHFPFYALTINQTHNEISKMADYQIPFDFCCHIVILYCQRIVGITPSCTHKHYITSPVSSPLPSTSWSCEQPKLVFISCYKKEFTALAEWDIFLVLLLSVVPCWITFPCVLNNAKSCRIVKDFFLPVHPHTQTHKGSLCCLTT